MKLLFYLITMNVIGLYTVYYMQKQKMNFNALFIFLGLTGSAFGIILGKYLFHYRPSKENMLMQVLLPCILIWQIVGIAMYKHGIAFPLDFNLFGLFMKYTWLLYYLLGANLLVFLLFGLDKLKAVKDFRRIPITTLLLGCAAGGAFGGILGMFAFHHKIRKNYFTFGVPAILITQILILLCIVNW